MHSQPKLALPQPRRNFTDLCTADFFFSGVMANFPQMLNGAFKIMEERSMRRGRGLQQAWYVSVAWSLVEMKMDPERAPTIKAQATERVAALYRSILDSWEREVRPQKPLSTSGTALQTVGPDTSSWFYSASVLGVSFGPRFGLSEVSMRANVSSSLIILSRLRLPFPRRILSWIRSMPRIGHLTIFGQWMGTMIVSIDIIILLHILFNTPSTNALGTLSSMAST
jgi:hypothetical protein